MGALIVSALVAIGAANAGDWWAAEALAASSEARETADENGRLAARVDELESLARAEVTAVLHERMEGQR